MRIGFNLTREKTRLQPVSCFPDCQKQKSEGVCFFWFFFLPVPVTVCGANLHTRCY